jgi:hypothetical protein
MLFTLLCRLAAMAFIHLSTVSVRLSENVRKWLAKNACLLRVDKKKIHLERNLDLIVVLFEDDECVVSAIFVVNVEMLRHVLGPSAQHLQ